MLKIKKFTIENFRGIKQQLVIDFAKGGAISSVAIHGRNGTGKSSIVDAWEWLTTQNIEHLNREGVSPKDFPHKSSNGTDSYFEVEFQHATLKTLRIAYNKTKITAPTITGDYPLFKSLSVYPNHLRYADLQQFVYLSKTDKYKYIAKFFGLEKYVQNQSDLQAYIFKLQAKLDIEQRSFDTLSASIKTLTGSPTIDEPTIVAYINSISAKHGIAPITHFKNSKAALEALKKQVESNPKTQELTEWKSFKQKLDRFFPITKVKSDVEKLEATFKTLKSDEKSITQLFLAELYKTGASVIPKLEDPSICPLCDKKFVGDFLGHVKAKHESLDALNRTKALFDSQKAALLHTLNLIARKAAIIRSEPGFYVLAALTDFFADLKIIAEGIPATTEILAKQLSEIESLEISTQPFVAKIDAISGREVPLTNSVSAKIAALEMDETRKSLADDYANLKKVISDYYYYLVSSKKLLYLTTTKTNLENLLAQLTLFIQNKIQTTFSSIQAEVIDNFNILEVSATHIQKPEIKLIPGKDKAVELEIEFATDRISPAFKFLSESQVNSFGLAIFLAAVKYFNSDFKFIILDDVVSSFDAYKRPLVINLLNARFNDFQILMLTHDDVFFKEISQHFPTWHRNTYTKWDYTIGPTQKISRNYKEKIQDAIDNADSEDAGQKLGIYLEWMLGDLCEFMEAPIRYRRDGAHTLNDYFPALRNQFTDKLKPGTRKHKLVELFKELEMNASFRNFCMHKKGEPIPYTYTEIEMIFKKWIEIEDTIYCSTCRSFVKLDRTTSGDFVRCNGAHINLLDPSFYS